MKKSELKQIIKEEVANMLNESINIDETKRVINKQLDELNRAMNHGNNIHEVSRVMNKIENTIQSLSQQFKKWYQQI